jgi:carboxymethylenebutenolidase
LDVSDIDLTAISAPMNGSSPLRGYLATPSGDGPWPGVVMVHEAFGLDDVMRRQANRIAAAGFITLAVDLYSAGGARKCLVTTMRAMMKGEGRAFTDIDAARRWLAESPQCTGKIGSIGFCMGGGFVLLTVGTGFDAAAVNYGQLPTHMESIFATACPVVGSYGARDRTLKNAAAKLERALTNAGVVHDVKEYPNANHAFLNDAPAGPRLLRPLLRVAGMKPEPESAKDAWRRIDAFFYEHLR